MALAAEGGVMVLGIEQLSIKLHSLLERWCRPCPFLTAVLIQVMQSIALLRRTFTPIEQTYCVHYFPPASKCISGIVLYVTLKVKQIPARFQCWR